MSKQRPLSATARTRQQQSRGPQWYFPLTRTNFLYFGIAMGVILLGFALMATGMSSPESTTPEKWGSPIVIGIAPVLLVVGFCVLLPYAIMKRDKNTNSAS
jgi:fatty acid desaturase